MTLQDLGNLSQFVGGIAIVISLVYLAIQVRQNTRALNSTAYAQAAEQTWMSGLAIAQDADLARIMVAANHGTALSAEDQLRLQNLHNNVYYGGEYLFRQYELGLLDADTWENVVQNFTPRSSPVASVFLEGWHSRQGPLAQRFRAYLEELYAKVGDAMN